jgi:RNA 2',3'-cyclic 3'-phosphodiesterase
MRTFVAWNPDDSVRRSLAGALGELVAAEWPVRWVDPADLHLTLCFLGEVPAAQIDAVSAALHGVVAGRPPFELRLGGFGAFPSMRRPRVLWVGVEPAPALLALQRELSSELRGVGSAREEPIFTPHITVARLRRDARPPSGVEAASRRFDWSARQDVASIAVMKSIPDTRGSRYERVLSVDLGGA